MRQTEIDYCRGFTRLKLQIEVLLHKQRPWWDVIREGLASTEHCLTPSLRRNHRSESTEGSR